MDDGKKVFKEEKKTVKELEKIVKKELAKDSSFSENNFQQCIASLKNIQNTRLVNYNITNSLGNKF